MAYTYRYTGDAPTVFIHMQKNGHTFVPAPGDTLESDVPIQHPLLELVESDHVLVGDNGPEIVVPVAYYLPPVEAAAAELAEPELTDSAVVPTNDGIESSGDANAVNPLMT